MKKILHLSLLAILLCGLSAVAQTKPETVFEITNEDKKPDGEKHYFGQIAISFPIRANPYRNQTDFTINTDGSESASVNDRNYGWLDVIYPDGLSIHYGLGLHYHKWIGVSANVGLDWIGTEKLVSAPVYGALFFCPQIWDHTNVYLQAGLGHTFALGRGELSGTYQKYRLGANFNNETTIFLEVNRYGFNLHDMNPAGSISIGISLTDMF